MRLSSLPRSLSQLRTAVQRSGSGAAIILGRRASAWQEAQGTRATPSQGTASSGNTPNPLHQGQSITPDRPAGWDAFSEMPDMATFSTDDPEFPNTQHATIMTRDWPPNPSLPTMAPPTNRVPIMTEHELHAGTPPARIMRFNPQRVFGAVVQAADRGMEGDTFPSWEYLQHIPVARRALGTKGPQKMADDNAVIPAIFAGNPRQ